MRAEAAWGGLLKTVRHQGASIDAAGRIAQAVERLAGGPGWPADVTVIDALNIVAAEVRQHLRAIGEASKSPMTKAESTKTAGQAKKDRTAMQALRVLHYARRFRGTGKSYAAAARELSSSKMEGVSLSADAIARLLAKHLRGTLWTDAPPTSPWDDEPFTL
jgi:hypothetical protein